MQETTYTVTTTFGQFKFLANLVEASAPLRLLGDDDEYETVSPTPYQTADARHDETEAAVLLMRHLGSEYYLDPADDRDDLDHDAYVRGLIVSVDAEESDEPARTEADWWAWHDADQTRWSETTEEAEARCAAWVAGESDDGPEEG